MKKALLTLALFLCGSFLALGLFAQTPVGQAVSSIPGKDIPILNRWVPSVQHCSITCCYINGTPINAVGNETKCPSGELRKCTLVACDADCTTQSPPCP